MTERMSSKEFREQVLSGSAAQTKRQYGAYAAPSSGKAPNGEYEHIEQVKIFNWAKEMVLTSEIPELDFLYAVPNGSFRSKKAAGKLKAEGTKKGVVDIHWDIPRGHYHGWKGELKALDKNGRHGNPSDDQWKWINFHRSQNFFSDWFVGFEAVRDSLIEYYALGPFTPQR